MKTASKQPAAALALLIMILSFGSAFALESRPVEDNWWAQVKEEWDEAWDRAWSNDSYDDESWSDEEVYPRNLEGRVRFRYEDDGYTQVYLTGDFLDWEREAMDLSYDDDTWEISLELDSGHHLYRFVVVDEEDEWSAIDPANFDSRKLHDRGRVSVLDLDSHRKSRRGRRYREYDRVERELMMNYNERDLGMENEVDYQRVDGLVLGYSPVYVAENDFEPSARGRISYGFQSDHWSAGLTILQPLAKRNLLWLKVDGFHGTDYRDRTDITDAENFLAMCFFRKDFRDYFQREGVAFSLVFAGLDWLRLEGGLRSDDYFSRGNTSNWSFADGHFAENLPVDEGTLRSVFGKLRLGTLYNNIELSYERSGEEVLGGMGDYELVQGTWRTRVPMGPRQRIDLRVKGGTNLRGHLPLQRRFLAGGLGTVRGFDYQSLFTPDPDGSPADAALYGGERMALANLEYGFRLFEEVNLFALYDIGMVYEDRQADIKLDGMKESAGFGFGIDDAGLRVNVMKPLDGDDGDTVVQLRLERTF